jgi:hypothetical protein
VVGLGTASFIPPPLGEVEPCLAAWERFLHESNLPPLVTNGLAHDQFEAAVEDDLRSFLLPVPTKNAICFGCASEFPTQSNVCCWRMAVPATKLSGSCGPRPLSGTSNAGGPPECLIPGSGEKQKGYERTRPCRASPFDRPDRRGNYGGTELPEILNGGRRRA